MNKKVILGLILLVVLTVGIGVGVYFGVNRNQNIGSKATGTCDMRWPADPTSGCGKRTQIPVQDATITTLTPDFHWDYDTHSTDKNICDTPSGCSTYSASIYLSKDSASNSPFARCDTAISGSPVKDCAFSAFKLCNGDASCHTDGQPSLGSLEANKTYFWKVTPFFNGVVHAEQTWIYTFTTGAGTQTVGCNQTCKNDSDCDSGYCFADNPTPPMKRPTIFVCRNRACETETSCVCPVTPPVAACQKVTASKDLSTVKIGDTVTFTGYGTLSNQAADDSIDMIRFAIASTSGTLTQDVNTTLDSAGVWKATLDYLIKGASSYTVTIQAHWKSTNQWLP